MKLHTPRKRGEMGVLRVTSEERERDGKREKKRGGLHGKGRERRLMTRRGGLLPFNVFSSRPVPSLNR